VEEHDVSAYLESVRAMIEEHGHAVQVVGGSPGWAYTIGLHAAGLPELIVVGGLSVEGQHRTLNALADRLRSGEVLAVGERDPSVLEGVDVTYLEVADTTSEEFAVAVKLQAAFRALQVVWPDMENRFPWEAGDAFPPSEQPLLGPAPA
jgi:hypothetical protein